MTTTVNVIWFWLNMAICWIRPQGGRSLKEYGLTQEDLALKAYDITNRRRAIFRSPTLDRETAKVKFREWYKDVSKCSLREMKAARDAVRSREDKILNYFIVHSTNAGAESFNSKIKGFRAQLRGVSDLPFFMFRLCSIFG